MGIYDRDYYRSSPRSGFGGFQPWSVTTWLIVVNVVIFFIDGVLGGWRHEGPLTAFGYFSAFKAIDHLELWRFVTYQFLHNGPWHLFRNMIALYFFGPIVEGQFGARRYIGFYLSCGVAGALLYILLWATGMLVDDAAAMVDASGSIMGVLVAAAVIAPGITITLWFPPIPVTIHVLAVAYVGIAIYQVMTQGGNAIAEAAHLGGAIWGYVLIRNQHWLNMLTPRSAPIRRKRKRVAFTDWTKNMDH